MPAYATQLGTVQTLLLTILVGTTLGKDKAIPCAIKSNEHLNILYSGEWAICSACLLIRGRPLLEGFHVLRRWRHQYEGLAACHDMVPHRAAPKVNMEVCVAARRAHEPIK